VSGASSTILVIDDDVELCELLGEYLGAEGFAVYALAAIAFAASSIVALRLPSKRSDVV